jgi:hypothetical protein
MIVDRDDVDEYGTPLDCRAEIDEFWARPPPPAVSDADLQAILADLPKNIDAAVARRELEAVWSMHLNSNRFHPSLGLQRTKSKRVAAHLNFVETARAFIEAFTEHIDKLLRIHDA